MISLYVLTWLGVLLAQISPGPNLVAVASIGLGQGRRPALFVATGVATGMLVWSFATAIGLGTLIEAFPLSLLFLKLFGGGYLLFLSIKAAHSALAKTSAAVFQPDTEAQQDGQAWRRGVFVILSNPKAALMWAAVASFLFSHGLDAWHVMAFGPLGAFSGLVIYGTYAWLFSTNMAMRGYNRFSRWFEGIFASVFGLMGVSLLWSGVHEVRNEP